MKERRQAEPWRDAVILDAGDAFSEVAQLPAERLANAVATAELLVDHLSAEGLAAQALGERDLALGRATLEALAKRAKYPFVTTNLVDAESGKPLFSRFQVIAVTRGEGKTVKLGVFGLMAERTRPEPEAKKLRILPPLEALKAALPEARAAGAEVIIVLSQLNARDEAMVGEALPEVQLFLGGDAMLMTAEGQTAGQALSFAGSQKGKHVGFMKLTFEDPAGARAPLFDPGRKQSLVRKQSDAKRRIEMYERLIAEAAAKATSPPPGPAPNARPNVPSEVYQRQLTAARAELQLASEELGALSPESEGAKRNRVSAELVPLSKDVADDAEQKAKVDAFRKTWPDLTPGH